MISRIGSSAFLICSMICQLTVCAVHFYVCAISISLQKGQRVFDYILIAMPHYVACNYVRISFCKIFCLAA